MTDDARGVSAWDVEDAPQPVDRVPLSPLRLATLGVAVALIALSGAQGGLAAEDATVLINARNGLEHSPILYFYAGYASLIPDVISWSLRGLPLTAQAIGYMLVAWAAGMLLGEEAFRFLRRFQQGPVALAGAVFLLWLTHSQSSLVYLNLTYVIWPLLMWGALRLARAAAEEKALGWTASGLLLLIGLSQPLAAAWTPALLWLAWRARGAVRWRMLGLLALIGAYDAANLLLAPHVTAGIVPFGEAWRLFTQGEGRIGPRDGLVHLAALICLAGAVVLGARAVRGESSTRERAMLQLLVFGALATLAYLASDRFLLYRSLVERYGLPALVSLAAAGLAALPLRRERGWVVAAAVTLLLLPTIGLARGHLQRQMGELGRRLAFLDHASAWRGSCGDAQTARVLTPADRWSLAVPCTPWPTPTASGFYRLTPQGSLAFSAEMSLETAGVYVGAPVIGVRRATP